MTTTICEHENFRCTVEVNRLVNGHLDFSADVKIKCADCGRPFVFLGLPRGLALQGAAISFDAQEARLAIKPSITEGDVL